MCTIGIITSHYVGLLMEPWCILLEEVTLTGVSNANESSMWQDGAQARLLVLLKRAEGVGCYTKRAARQMSKPFHNE